MEDNEEIVVNNPLQDKDDIITEFKRKVAMALAVALFLIGALTAVNVGRLVPTFNGEIDVNYLQDHPDDYDLSEADGVAYVIVAKDLADTNGTNVCYSVVFNFRGYDTMGESILLVAAIIGCMTILHSSSRVIRDNPIRDVVKAKGVIVRSGINILIPLACVYGGYVILHGDSSPGGGFQGGVVVASIVLLVFLGYYRKNLYKVFKEHFLHNTETLAEIAYILIGVYGIVGGGIFATNIILENIGYETATFMNDAVGIHVACGICFLLLMLLNFMNSEEEDK